MLFELRELDLLFLPDYSTGLHINFRENHLYSRSHVKYISKLYATNIFSILKRYSIVLVHGSGPDTRICMNGTKLWTVTTSSRKTSYRINSTVRQESLFQLIFISGKSFPLTPFSIFTSKVAFFSFFENTLTIVSQFGSLVTILFFITAACVASPNSILSWPQQ